MTDSKTATELRLMARLVREYDYAEISRMLRKAADELEQAIAATLGSGECEFVVNDNMNETEGMGDVWFECSECGAQFDYVTDTRLMDANFCPNCGKVVKR